MSYTITSDNFEGKAKGDSITEKELLESGLNIEALITGEHLKKTATTKPVEEVK